MAHYEPDWSRAPGWANFWAINIDSFPDGDVVWACWYQNEPKYHNGIWISPSGLMREDKQMREDRCIDGRTLRRRPA